jgi:uncharacterized protein (UPF0303 family)
MTDGEISTALLAAEEAELQFDSFTADDAWALGTALVAAARAEQAPVAIDISRNGQQLFHAALPGAVADNDRWIERKTRVVQRFGHSTLHVRQLCAESGEDFAEKFLVDPRQYAAHGGGFPIAVRSVGVIGAVVVSGLPQLDDHRLVVTTLRAFLTGGRPA